jgi:hypothetical protein
VQAASIAEFYLWLGAENIILKKSKREQVLLLNASCSQNMLASQLSLSDS